MSFAHPLYLFGLLGLAIPIAIHLLSRKEGRVVPMGSLRHITASSTRQFRSLRLNEILLLLLRCLLLTVLVLWLSTPLLPYRSGKRLVLTEPGLENTSAAQKLLAPLLAAGFEHHQWSAGFPAPGTAVQDTSSHQALMRAMRNLAPDSAVVITTSRALQFAGSRTALPATVNWVVVPGEPKQYPVAAQQVGDSIWVRVAASNETLTALAYEKKHTTDAAITLLPADTLVVTIHAGEKFQSDAQRLRAVLHAIDGRVPAAIQITESINPRTDWLCWLDTTSVPDNIPNQLVWAEQQHPAPLKILSSHRIALTRHLTPDVLTQTDVVLQFTRMLFPATAAQRRTDAGDQRSVEPELVWKKDLVSMSQAGVSDWLQPWLLLAILLLLIAERVLAYLKKL